MLSLNASPAKHAAPFHTSILPEASRIDQILALLPAWHEPSSDRHGFLATSQESLSASVEQELDLGRLSELSAKLWIAGRAGPPKTLHRQELLGRELVVTEQMDLHLVWTSGRIYIKPIPPFLLMPRIWAEILCCCPRGCRCDPATKQYCNRQETRRSAMGFMLSYVALIRHQSDFHIATGHRLVPEELDWPRWKRFVAEILSAGQESLYEQAAERFCYGELRLSRLNKLHLWARGSTYVPQWNQYKDFLHDNLTLLASAMVYIVVLLTAMQLGHETSLASNDLFQSVSYGFTMFAILAPLIVMVLLFTIFVGVFVWNWILTLKGLGERLGSIQGTLHGGGLQSGSEVATFHRSGE
ncbi:DUF6601 domain-containing protein [Microdochium nivale]|nr:DUF6601 domain-containing protein [Microdochium nivale]